MTRRLGETTFFAAVDEVAAELGDVAGLCVRFYGERIAESHHPLAVVYNLIYERHPAVDALGARRSLLGICERGRNPRVLPALEKLDEAERAAFGGRAVIDID
jgi:hypothetical protein